MPDVRQPYLFVTEVVHPCRYVHGELQQLLGGERGGGAVLLGEGGVRLQHSTLPQEVQKVTVRSVFNGYVQVACKRYTEGAILGSEEEVPRSYFSYGQTNDKLLLITN